MGGGCGGELGANAQKNIQKLRQTDRYLGRTTDSQAVKTDQQSYRQTDT